MIVVFTVWAAAVSALLLTALRMWLKRTKHTRHEKRCQSCQYARAAVAEYLTRIEADFDAWNREMSS